jgi:hypothetical protein
MQDKFSQLARLYGVSLSVVETLARALQTSGGHIARFNHPELGGVGQWTPGNVIVSDKFDHALKARIDALCSELSVLIVEEKFVIYIPDSSQQS